MVFVIAHRGDQACIRKCTGTIDYPSGEVDGSKFHRMPLDLSEMYEALRQDRLKFILTNLGNYVDLERKFGVSHIANLNPPVFNAIKLFGKWWARQDSSLGPVVTVEAGL